VKGAAALAESMAGLVGRLVLAAALVFVGFVIKDVFDWLSHGNAALGSTPARGASAVETKTYQVATVIPCGSLALVDVKVHVSVADSALFGLLGAHVDATYPERMDVCVGGDLLAAATVTKKGTATSVVVAVPTLHPISTGVNEFAVSSGGVGTAWYQSATSGEINSVESTSRRVADVSTALTPLPAKQQRSLVLAAEKQALPGLRREFGTRAVTFRPTPIISPVDQIVANWRTFGPEIRSAFPSARFSIAKGATELTVTAKDGTGGVASIGQAVTAEQLAKLNGLHVKAAS
jgi:hypothetical protein